ncbi:hypothetical protein BC828DRAFT_242889 [Blastocladiella britannica]|nr:hypothetical protein BC828DRAFT_242889 [Blastocladiella britannica]
MRNTLSATLLASSPNLAAGHAGAGFARSRRGSSNSQNGGAGGGGAGGTSPYARPVSPSGPRRGSAASSTSPVFAAGSLSPTFAPSDDGGVNGPPTGEALKRSGTAGAGCKTKPLEKKYLCDFPGCDKAFDRPSNLR